MGKKAEKHDESDSMWYYKGNTESRTYSVGKKACLGPIEFSATPDIDTNFVKNGQNEQKWNGF